MADVPSGRKLWLRRFGWLALIWGASVGALAIVAILFRVFMKMAGMTV